MRGPLTLLLVEAMGVRYRSAPSRPRDQVCIGLENLLEENMDATCGVCTDRNMYLPYEQE